MIVSSMKDLEKAIEERLIVVVKNVGEDADTVIMVNPSIIFELDCIDAGSIQITLNLKKAVEDLNIEFKVQHFITARKEEG